MTHPNWCNEKTWEAAAYAVANAPEYTQRLHEDVARAIMKEREQCAGKADRMAKFHRDAAKMNLPVSPGPIIANDRAKAIEQVAAAIRNGDAS